MPDADPLRTDDLLGEAYPDAHCELDFTSPLELLVATVLSAQCTDERVNLTTPALFARFPDAVAYAGADRAELEDLIRPTGFFRNKATALLGIGAALVERFGGKVPATMDELVSLPGVPVDTHVGRVTRRLGWTVQTDAVKLEHELMEMFPPERWTMLSHRLIFHGRRTCFARSPACHSCPVAELCPSYPTGEPPAPQATTAKQKADEKTSQKATAKGRTTTKTATATKTAAATAKTGSGKAKTGSGKATAATARTTRARATKVPAPRHPEGA